MENIFNPQSFDSYVVYPNGVISSINPKKKYFSYEELQKLVDGYIAMFEINDTYCAVVNEDGYYKNLKINEKGRELIAELAGRNKKDYCELVGNVCIINKKRIK